MKQQRGALKKKKLQTVISSKGKDCKEKKWLYYNWR